MTARLSVARVQAIATFQRLEIERLATDPSFAAESAQLEHYSRIGRWSGAKRGGHVLELGCGPGRYAALLASLGCRITALDPSAFETWSIVRQSGRVGFVTGARAEELPFTDQSFDGVACLGALLYFIDPVRALSEIYRVLKPGGDLALRTINRRNLYGIVRRRPIDPATRNVYTMSELESLVREAGFTIGERFAYGFYSPVFANWWWFAVNGVISISAQQRLSALTPALLRSNLVLFARKPA